jgi:hypothetical protein
MTIWSGRFSRSRSLVMVGMKSSATVQQMQPLVSSMISSSLQASAPQPFSTSPSTPRSPNSLMISAMRRPAGILQDVADHRRLAGAEETGDDGRRESSVGGFRVVMDQPFIFSGNPAAIKYTFAASAAIIWCSRPAWSRKSRAMRFSGTMPRPTSLETRTS